MGDLVFSSQIRQDETNGSSRKAKLVKKDKTGVPSDHSSGCMGCLFVLIIISVFFYLIGYFASHTVNTDNKERINTAQQKSSQKMQNTIPKRKEPKDQLLLKIRMNDNIQNKEVSQKGNQGYIFRKE